MCRLIPPVREITGASGARLAPAGDEGGLTEACDDLLSSYAHRQALGEAGRARVREHYDIAMVARRVEEI